MTGVCLTRVRELRLGVADGSVFDSKKSARHLGFHWIRFEPAIDELSVLALRFAVASWAVAIPPSRVVSDEVGGVGLLVVAPLSHFIRA